jgi:hypothetical protein
MIRDLDEELLTVIPVRTESIAEATPLVLSVEERSWRPEALLVGLCAVLFLLTTELGERERRVAEWEARPAAPTAQELSQRTGVAVRSSLRGP